MSFFQEISLALENSTIFTVFFFVLGSVFASFFNVVAFRTQTIINSENASDIKGWMEEKNISVPKEVLGYIKDMNLSFPSSHCYSCSTPLKWYHNIPILSYIFLRGKCGFCKTPYSVKYPIVEFIGGAILSSVYLYFFPKYGLECFILASLFFMIGYVLLLVDLESMILPDGLNYSLLWIGLLASTQAITIINELTATSSIYGATLGFIIMWTISTVGEKIKGVSVMGDGDLKLIAAIGAFTGMSGALFTIFFSPFLGIFTWLYMKLTKVENPEFPYGPALIISSWIYIFYGKSIFSYLNLPL